MIAGVDRRIAVVGSRDWPRLSEVSELVKSFPADALVISGGARGVDSAAEAAAAASGIAYLIFPAQWTLYGIRAGFRRNLWIVKNATEVYAFQLKGSRGTQNTIDIARERGLKVTVFTEETDFDDVFQRDIFGRDIK